MCSEKLRNCQTLLKTKMSLQSVRECFLKYYKEAIYKSSRERKKKKNSVIYGMETSFKVIKTKETIENNTI